MEKITQFVAVAVVGAFVTALIDEALGINIGSFFPRIVHTTIYLLWGGVIAKVIWRNYFPDYVGVCPAVRKRLGIFHCKISSCLKIK